MLISLLMNVCLSEQTASCRQERIDFVGSAMSCMMTAQPVVAEWADLNPDWRVASWTCRAA